MYSRKFGLRLRGKCRKPESREWRVSRCIGTDATAKVFAIAIGASCEFALIRGYRSETITAMKQKAATRSGVTADCECGCLASWLMERSRSARCIEG